MSKKYRERAANFHSSYANKIVPARKNGISHLNDKGLFMCFLPCSALPGRLHQSGAGEIPAGHHQLYAFIQREQWQEHTQQLHLHTYEHLGWVDEHTLTRHAAARGATLVADAFFCPQTPQISYGSPRSAL